jgi:gas vesicle protein
MSEINRNHPTSLLLAFLAGAVTGAAVALLTAPQSGRETRKRLKGVARNATRTAAARVPPTLHEAYSRAARAARQAFIEVLEAGAPESGSRTGAAGH